MIAAIVRGSRSIPVAEWPAADRTAWDIALQPPDLLEPDSGIGDGHWVGWLDRSGLLGPASTSESRIKSAACVDLRRKAA